MTLTAPPRPPHLHDPVDRDELEALIEEARRRTRRRRRIYASAATLVTLGAGGLFAAVERGGPSEATSPAGAPGAGVPVTAGHGQIAFFRGPPFRPGGAAYIMNADGSGERRLAPDSLPSARGASSPDGRKFAITSERNGNVDIYVSDPDAGGLRRLTRNMAFDLAPRWSRDGRKISFVRSTGDWRSRRFSIYEIHADGSGERRLTPTVAGEPGRWSPDGRKITFERLRGVNRDIYVMNVETGKFSNLTRSPAHETADVVGVCLHQLGAVGCQHGFTVTSTGSHRAGAPSAWIVPR